jgi:antitoxin (DNA-binding transcriptional repressor) of toxin-antitoxin stability system
MTGFLGSAISIARFLGGRPGRGLHRPVADGYFDSYPAESSMSQYSVAAAKNALPKLIDRALAGEEVVITRRGKPVVELRRTQSRPQSPIGSDEWLAERRRTRPAINITSVELLNLIYDSDDE